MPLYQGLKCSAVSTRFSDALPNSHGIDEEDEAQISTRGFVLSLRGGRSKARRGGHSRSESSDSA